MREADEKDLDALLAARFGLEDAHGLEALAEERAHALEAVALKDLREKGPALLERGVGDGDGALDELLAARGVGLADARRVRCHVRHDGVEGSVRRDRRERAREHVELRGADLLGNRHPEGVQVERHHEAAGAYLVGQVLRPAPRRGAEVEHAETRTRQTDAPIDLFELVDRPRREAFLMGLRGERVGLVAGLHGARRARSPERGAAQALPRFFTAPRSVTMPFSPPGAEPSMSTRFWSAMTFTTLMFCTVARALPS